MIDVLDRFAAVVPAAEGEPPLSPVTAKFGPRVSAWLHELGLRLGHETLDEAVVQTNTAHGM
ncbi:hypothetical protein [Luteipulveratus mongoliensis]|uniref:Uncharacterized protein n=1 Tax=Luteipulveratus mongoliensis TaxID=571913 RepID=A0A0K1JNT3_9MICO|nr:hypothetical protein [Luteipulveratus mongoliensis]AKU18225.1 hypothetical protein VV02_24180 [Luteipulveratus mongoliensis]